MILKIRRNYGGKWVEIPEVVVECDRYDRRAYDPGDSKFEAAESMFCDENGEINPRYTIHTFKNGKFTHLFLVGHATVFVMNNEGKTTDTINA